MSDQERMRFIQLIRCIPPTEQQKKDPLYIPQLEINTEATDILMERFQSPISIVVFMGNLGVGKSKLASLMMVSLLEGTEIGQESEPFKSGEDPKGVTYGVWMSTRPVKRPNRIGGSVLILDCEGMEGDDEKRNRHLYLFCLIVSSVLGLVLRPARIDRNQCHNLYEGLCQFKSMKAPCVLPSAYIIALELPVLKCDGKNVTPKEWIETIFRIDTSTGTLTDDKEQELKKKYQVIRDSLSDIDVANLHYLPNELKENELALSQMQVILKNKSNKEYRDSLKSMIEKMKLDEGKRLPGCNCIPALLVRPAELALFMSDLIDVINSVKDPNPDELIGRCLLKRFEDEILHKKLVQFQKKFLEQVFNYAKEKINDKNATPSWDTMHERAQKIHEELRKKFVSEIEHCAKKQIYGTDSPLLESQSYRQSVINAQDQFQEFKGPELLLQHVQRMYDTFKLTADRDAQVRSIYNETEDQLNKMIERIFREKEINKAIQKSEFQCELEVCASCRRQGGIYSVMHHCADGRLGNYYRYLNDQLVCSQCRRLEYLHTFKIICASSRCQKERVVRRIIQDGVGNN